MLAAGLATGAAMSAPPGVFGGQQANPVYVDDSPAAADTFVRVREHVSAGNLDEAVRILQVLLDDQPDRLVVSGTDPDLFVNVRGAVNDLLLASPKLLERYRAMFGPRAERQLSEGQTDVVERSLMLTPSGLDAVLRLSQLAMEDARFEHARQLLEQADKHPDRTGDRAKLASQMMTTLARYLGRAPVSDMARQGWAKDAGEQPPDLAPVQWPAAATKRAATPMLPAVPMATEGMVSKPLWTVPLNPTASTPEATLNSVDRSSGRGQVSVPMYARELLQLPSVADDTVFISDGTQIERLGSLHARPAMGRHARRGGRAAARAGRSGRPTSAGPLQLRRVRRSQRRPFHRDNLRAIPCGLLGAVAHEHAQRRR